MSGAICESCNQRAAKIHITQILNQKVNQLNLCPDCAQEKGLNGPGVKPLPSLSTLDDIKYDSTSHPDETKTCQNCGQTFRGFRESGRLGCAQCYVEFEEELIPLFRKIQAGISHVGSNPETPTAPVVNVLASIQKKRELLRLSVVEEDFETAARLRDEIRQLEKESNP